jgi:hypothetical protein
MVVCCAILLLLLLQLVERYGCSLLLLLLLELEHLVLLSHAVGGAGVADAELRRRDLQALDFTGQCLVQSCSSEGKEGRSRP